MPPASPAMIAKTSSRPVISISARKRGTTRFLIGSTPSTWRASSSSRILRAPRSAVIAVPAIPAPHTPVTKGPLSAGGGEEEEAAEPVEGAEEREEVGRLQARGAEVDGQGRDQQREPAQLQGEEELADELLAIGIGRTDRRSDRPTGEENKLPYLFKHRLCGQECPIHRSSDHLLLQQATPSGRGKPHSSRGVYG